MYIVYDSSPLGQGSTSIPAGHCGKRERAVIQGPTHCPLHLKNMGLQPMEGGYNLPCIPNLVVQVFLRTIVVQEP